MTFLNLHYIYDICCSIVLSSVASTLKDWNFGILFIYFFCSRISILNSSDNITSCYLISDCKYSKMLIFSKWKQQWVLCNNIAIKYKVIFNFGLLWPYFTSAVRISDYTYSQNRLLYRDIISEINTSLLLLQFLKDFIICFTFFILSHEYCMYNIVKKYFHLGNSQF